MHPSPCLEQMLGSLERCRGPARVLDLGPAEEATLSFLGDRHLEMHVASLDPDPAGRVKLPEYDAGAFRAILGWDFLLRVEAGARPKLAQALSRWLAPAGDLLLVLPISTVRRPMAFRFRVQGPSALEYRPVGPLVGGSILTTREVLSLFPDLEGNGARILRHGAREFLLHRPAEEA